MPDRILKDGSESVRKGEKVEMKDVMILTGAGQIGMAIARRMAMG